MAGNTTGTLQPDSDAVIRLPQSRATGSTAPSAALPAQNGSAGAGASAAGLEATTAAVPGTASRTLFDRGFLVAAAAFLLAITVLQPTIALAFIAAAVVFHMMRPRPGSRTRNRGGVRADPPNR